MGTGMMVAEQGTNLYSVFGGIYGTAFDVGWEGGRAITETSGYQYWKASFIKSLGGYYVVPREYQRSLIDECLNK